MNTTQANPTGPTGNPQNPELAAIHGFNNGNRDQPPLLYRSNTGRSRRPRSHVPNTRDNATAFLTLAKAIELVEAAEHATLIGNPLNVFLTIHFGAAKLEGRYRGQDAVSRFMRLAGQWLRTKGVQNTFIWVLEHATGTGEHAHVMMHCPPWLLDAFKAKAEGSWMAKSGMLPKAKAKNGILIERIGPRGYYPTTHTGHERHRRQLNGVLQYCLKAIDPDSVPANDNGAIPIQLPNGHLIEVAHEHSNAIYGHRCYRSENIGPTARRRYQAQLMAEAS